MTLQVIVDSNFLLTPALFKVDVFRELERLARGRVETLLLTPVLRELERLARSRSVKLQRAARLAADLAGKCKVVNVKPARGETVDDVIVREAKRRRCAVATNDSGLRRRLRALNIPTIYLRGRSHLEAEGALA